LDGFESAIAEPSLIAVTFKVCIRRTPVEDRGELIGMISLSSLILDNELF